MPIKNQKPQPISNDFINDVTQPAATATGRPIIVTNRPLLQDPMMVSAPVLPSGLDPEQSEKLATKIQVTPLEESNASNQNADESKTETAPASIQDVVSKPTDDASQTNAETEDQLLKATKAHESELVHAAEEREAAAAEVEELIQKKEYFLSINSVERRRSKQTVALGLFLALILGLVLVDLLMEVGVLSLGNIEPVTHFFDN